MLARSSADRALRQQKFEILYPAATHTMDTIDKSVSSCTASLEAFHEFFLRAMAYENGIKKERFDAAWKPPGISPQNRQEAYLLNYRIPARASRSTQPPTERPERLGHAERKMPTREECVKSARLRCTVVDGAWRHEGCLS